MIQSFGRESDRFAGYRERSAAQVAAWRRAALVNISFFPAIPLSQALAAGSVLVAGYELHQRGLAMAVLSVRGSRFGIASMHLGLAADERVKHVPEVLSHLECLGDVPIVLAGDPSMKTPVSPK